MARIQQVALVGHCGPDTYLLRSKVRQVLGDVPVAMVNDDAELGGYLSPASLLMVNRVLDGAFEAGDGIALIESLARRQAAPVMMLISNYADAQDRAVAAGAWRGFGKAELGLASTDQRLKEATSHEN